MVEDDETGADEGDEIEADFEPYTPSPVIFTDEDYGLGDATEFLESMNAWGWRVRGGELEVLDKESLAWVRVGRAKATIKRIQ